MTSSPGSGKPDHTPENYWTSWEGSDPIHGLSDLHEFVEKVANIPRLSWRGVKDHRWGLHSTLFRWASDRLGRPPTAEEFDAAEKWVVDKARQWNLDRVPSARSALELLAWMQHTGSPTRLVDVSLNPLVAAWFACEETDPPVDGRLFTINSGDGVLVDDGAVDLVWDDPEVEPRARLWVPPPIDQRIAAQSGAFLVGPLPRSSSGGRWYPKHDSNDRYNIEEVRALTSLSVRAYKKVEPGKTYRSNPMTSIRIPASAKKTLREDLERVYNLTPLLLFPDPFGLAGHLKRSMDWP